MEVAAVVFVVTTASYAAPTLRISADNGATWTNVVDNGPLDVDDNVGSILYNGAPGAFTGVFVASSQHNPDVLSYVNLNCTIFSASAPLVFQYSDSGFNPFNGKFESSIGGNGSSSVDCRMLLDTNGQLFAGTNLASATGLTGDFAWSSSSPLFSIGTYSLTAEVRTSAPSSGTKFDLLLEAYTPSHPKLLKPTIANGAVNLSFDTESGFTYTLECKSSLGQGEWTPLQTVDGNDAVVTVVDAAPLTHSKFYRVSVH
jgi:hypothetical protein